ncbi:hypothetical protein ILUMI_18470 [Ignelater luminosus]|uniref:Glucose-methanol-choline oxidoreductase C-terminal domain-containing protein n=1 Tax=Ignelater luminosus TaxID=2038154 RepID=A0A8K0CM11_IGNLU|nr:hypothetical protein ILUMI_18470 [Ignelater luminosus]
MIPSFNNNGTVPIFSTFRQEYLEVLRTIDLTHSFRLVVISLRPKSRGIIKLRSNNPYEYPLIDVNLLSDSNNEDIATLYDGVQIAINMTKTVTFQKLNTTLLDNSLPVCRQYEYLSREYWYCQFKQLGSHIAHAVGTCKMGPDPAKGAVVDHELKVHGIKNLRVADASIMPEVVSGHTHTPSVMIGEKLSQILKTRKFS